MNNDIIIKNQLEKMWRMLNCDPNMYRSSLRESFNEYMKQIVTTLEAIDNQGSIELNMFVEILTNHVSVENYLPFLTAVSHKAVIDGPQSLVANFRSIFATQIELGEAVQKR